MCGILAVIGSTDTELARKLSQKMSHRGPDESGLFTDGLGNILCHERLSIIDLKTGHQPIELGAQLALVHNGEIYNHAALRKTLIDPLAFKTKSDSEIILHLYREKGVAAIHDLDGVFAFILVDGERCFVGRDPIGVKPLFYGRDKNGALWFSSEFKSLVDACVDISEFPPGHYYTKEEGFVEYYRPQWRAEKVATGGAEQIKSSLIAAVKKRMMSDVPLGVLLSGGLDSSLLASIVSREMKKVGKKVKSYSVGIDANAHDLVAARKVAKHIGSDHHEVIFSPTEGLEALSELIHKLETYDVTTIRSATPMYLMMKYIRKDGVKVVLSGEGADEIFGGYMYFHNAPNSDEFHRECVRRVKLLYTSDVLRADRATMGAGVEARVPFLDLDFLQTSMSVDAKLKQCIAGKKIEKYVLREAFDDQQDPYLPAEILWRQKEQFQDGVGYSWVDGLKAYTESMVTDAEFAMKEVLFPYNTPATKEAFFYRKTFAQHFPHPEVDKLIWKWIPKWQGQDLDPSGRASVFHNASHHGPATPAAAAPLLEDLAEQTMAAISFGKKLA